MSQGEAIVKHHAHAGTPVGGFLAAAADIGIDTVPCYYAIAEPSGMWCCNNNHPSPLMIPLTSAVSTRILPA